MALSLGLLGVCMAVAAAVLAVAMPRIGTPTPLALFLRFAAVAGIAAVGASAMYLIVGGGGGPVPLVLGDVAMVLAPWLLGIGIDALDERRSRGYSIGAVVSALAVAVASATTPAPVPLVVKAVAIAIACGGCAGVALRTRAVPVWPMRMIAATTLLFGLSCVARVAVGLGAGWQSAQYLDLFSFAPFTVAGAVAVLLNGVAVVGYRFAHRGGGGSARRPTGTAVIVADWDLATAAFGADRMQLLVTELRTAARDLDPSATGVERGVDIALPGALPAVGRRLKEAYGWQPEEVTMLVDGSAAAVGPAWTGGRRRLPRRGGSRS